MRIDNFTTVAVRLFSVAGALLFSILISRWLPLQEAGEIFLVVTLFGLVSILARFGLDQILIKYSAIFLEESKTQHLRFIFLQALTFASLVSVIVGVLVTSLALSFDIFRALGKSFVICGVLVSVVHSSNLILVSLIKARGRVKSANFLEAGSANFLSVIFCVYLKLSEQLSVESALISLVAAHVLTLIVSACLANRGVGFQSSEQVVGETFSAILRSSSPFFYAALVSYLMQWMPVFLLSIFDLVEQIPLFNAVVRLTALIALPLAALSAVAGPAFARLKNEENRAELGYFARSISQNTLLMGAGGFVVLAIFGRQILAVFGDEFVFAYPALLVLGFCQLINVASGCSTLLLQMVGFQKVAFIIGSVVSLIACIAMVVLVSVYGYFGASIALGFGLIFTNIASVIWAKKNLGIEISFLFSRFRLRFLTG